MSLQLDGLEIGARHTLQLSLQGQMADEGEIVSALMIRETRPRGTNLFKSLFYSLQQNAKTSSNLYQITNICLYITPRKV